MKHCAACLLAGFMLFASHTIVTATTPPPQQVENNPAVILTPLDDHPAEGAYLPPIETYTLKDRKLGTWSYEAEQFANAQGCQSNNSGAWLIGRAQFADHYEVICKNGTRYTVVCDQVACRAG